MLQTIAWIFLTLILAFSPTILPAMTLELSPSLGYDSNIGEDSLKKGSFFTEYSLLLESERKSRKFDTFHSFNIGLVFRDYLRYDDSYELEMKIKNYRYITNKLRVDLTPGIKIYRDNLFEDDDTNSVSLSLDITNLINENLDITLGFSYENVSFLNYVPYIHKRKYRQNKFSRNSPKGQANFTGKIGEDTKRSYETTKYLEKREDKILGYTIKTQYYMNKNLNTIFSLSFVQNLSNTQLEEFNGLIFDFLLNYYLTRKTNFQLGFQFEKDRYNEYLTNKNRDDLLFSFTLKSDYKIRDNLTIYLTYDFIRKFSILDIDDTYKTELKCGFSFSF